MTIDFSPEVHLVATKLVPVVSTTQVVFRWLIGNSQAKPTTRAPQETTQMRVTQRHEQSTRVTLWRSTEVGTSPLTIDEASHEQSPTCAEASPQSPRRLGVGKHQE